MARPSVSLARKKELDKPDEFLSHSRRLFGFVMGNKLQLSCALGALFVLIIIYVGVQYYFEESGKKAFYLLTQGMSKYDSALKSDGIDKALEVVEKDFQLISEKYSRTFAGKIARINFANICYDAGKYKKAIALYEKALADFEDNILLKNIVLCGLAYSHEALNENTAALKYFEMITAGNSTVMKSEALFNLGRLYDAMGEKEKSVEMFKEIISEYNDSVYIDLVKEIIGG